MSAPLDVLAVMGRAAGLLDMTAPSHEPEAAAELLVAAAAVAELVLAADDLATLCDVGAYDADQDAIDSAVHRIRDLLAKFGGAA